MMAMLSEGTSFIQQLIHTLQLFSQLLLFSPNRPFSGIENVHMIQDTRHRGCDARENRETADSLVKR